MRACLVPWGVRGIVLALCAAFLASCGTLRPRHAAAPDSALSPTELKTARGLAHFTQGLICQMALGRQSTNALDEFVQAAEADPGEPRVYSRVAAMALLHGRPELAISTLENACRSEPRAVEPVMDLATVYQIAGRNDEAIRGFRQALRMAPTNVTAYLALANALFYEGKHSEALSALDKGWRHLGPPRGGAMLGFAYAQTWRCLQANDAAGALACLDFVAHRMPSERGRLFVLMGEIHERQGDTAGALRRYRLATVQKDPPSQAFVRLALLQLRSDPDDAVQTLIEAQRRLPDELMIPLALGQIYNTLNRLPQAVGVFDGVAEKAAEDPANRLTAGFYLQYGALCERAGDGAKAERIFEEGLRLYPSAHEILNYQAYTWAEKGTNLDLALNYVTHAINESPNNGAYIDTLGWVYYQQKRYADALVQLEKAAELMPGDPTITEHVGDALDALGERDKAILEWRHSYVLDPSNKALAAKLRANGINPVEVLKDAPPEEPNKALEQP